MNYHKEQTLVLVKPDGLARGLVGEIIKRFETKGFKLAALKMVRPNKAHIRKHYLSTRQQLEGMGNHTLESLKEHGLDPVKQFGSRNPLNIGKLINKWNFEFLSSSPVVAVVFEGLHAVEIGRKIVGNSMPVKAEPGTIRGDFSPDSAIWANSRRRTVKNIVHASGSIEEAKREIKHWFSKVELHTYKRIEDDLMFG